jgi:hypothetical protein
VIASRPRLKKLTDLLIRRYARIGVAEAAMLTPAADAYDKVFKAEVVPAIEALLMIERGHWTEKAGPSAIPAAGRIVEAAAGRVIFAPVTDYTVRYFPAFWQAGYDLWRINREMTLLPTPKRLDMTAAEGLQVAGYQRAELSAWQDHIVRHRRHVERFVHAAGVQGWTTAQFIHNMTAPDGHIVGFRYGNADLSWAEHLRRFTTGRPRMMAAACVEWRMRNAPGGRG